MRSLLLGIALRGESMFTLGKESDKVLQIEQKMVKRSIWKTRKCADYASMLT